MDIRPVQFTPRPSQDRAEYFRQMLIDALPLIPEFDDITELARSAAEIISEVDPENAFVIEEHGSSLHMHYIKGRGPFRYINIEGRDGSGELARLSDRWDEEGNLNRPYHEKSLVIRGDSPFAKVIHSLSFVHSVRSSCNPNLKYDIKDAMRKHRSILSAICARYKGQYPELENLLNI